MPQQFWYLVMICHYQVLRKQYDWLQVRHVWDQKAFSGKSDTCFYNRVCKQLFFDPLYLHHPGHCWQETGVYVAELSVLFITLDIPLMSSTFYCQTENRLVIVLFAVNDVVRIMEIIFIPGHFLNFFRFWHLLSI